MSRSLAIAQRWTAVVERCAQAAHGVNRAYCLFLGDESQPSWEDAPEWQRSSAIGGVLFHFDNPDVGSAGSHENWMREKLDDGWTYGEEKDPERKTHPCLVRYNELPEEQRFKDALFIRTVDAWRPLLPGHAL